MIKKVVLATVLTFSFGLTACGVDKKNEPKQENNTVVNENSSKENSTSDENSSKENSTSESEKESNIKEFQVNVPAGYIEKNGVYVNTSDESKTITVKLSVKKSQNEIDSAKGVSTQALVRIPKNIFIDYKKENFNGYTCYLVKTTEATKVYLEHNKKYLVTIEFNGIMCEDDEFKSFMNSFKVLDIKRVGYAGWFDAKIPEGYVETKSDNELTWEFTNQSDQSKRIIIELVKLSDGINKKAKDISYEHALSEKLADKEYIRFGSQTFGGFFCYILELKSKTNVYFDIDSNYSVQIRFCGIKYGDEELSSFMNSFEVFDGDIEENYKAYLNKK